MLTQLTHTVFSNYLYNFVYIDELSISISMWFTPFNWFLESEINWIELNIYIPYLDKVYQKLWIGAKSGHWVLFSGWKVLWRGGESVLLKVVYFPTFCVWWMLITKYWLGTCVLVIGCGVYLLGRTENFIKNFRQIFSVAADSDTGHLLHRAITQIVAYIQ